MRATIDSMNLRMSSALSSDHAATHCSRPVDQAFLGRGIGRVILDNIEHCCSITQPVMNAANDKSLQTSGRGTLARVLNCPGE